MYQPLLTLRILDTLLTYVMIVIHHFCLYRRCQHTIVWVSTRNGNNSQMLKPRPNDWQPSSLTTEPPCHLPLIVEVINFLSLDLYFNAFCYFSAMRPKSAFVPFSASLLSQDSADDNQDKLLKGRKDLIQALQVFV